LVQVGRIEALEPRSHINVKTPPEVAQRVSAISKLVVEYLYKVSSMQQLLLFQPTVLAALGDSIEATCLHARSGAIGAVWLALGSQTCAPTIAGGFPRAARTLRHGR
jgi:hypothetical protein